MYTRNSYLKGAFDNKHDINNQTKSLYRCHKHQNVTVLASDDDGDS